MKVGDLVVWSGWIVNSDDSTSIRKDEGATVPGGPAGCGIIVRVRSIGGSLRYDVLWPEGLVDRLFPQTIKLVNK